MDRSIFCTGTGTNVPVTATVSLRTGSFLFPQSLPGALGGCVPWLAEDDPAGDCAAGDGAAEG
jgi:hypothetical protein